MVLRETENILTWALVLSVLDSHINSCFCLRLLLWTSCLCFVGVGVGHRFVNFLEGGFCLFALDRDEFMRETWTVLVCGVRRGMIWSWETEGRSCSSPVGLHVTGKSRVFQLLVTSVERGWRLDSCPFPHSQPSHEPRIILTPHK